ncbi:hypothetical protein L0665_09975 [Methanogenium marinum]|uniref:Uncharacterized protein n=1 Tax=Methanogenium marinum TaxID=348610 RepID=A0A9Q4KV15_9EURY|nr:hypothetical protein [Methanogenium marinum]MDE4908933.1 hypothetical protein [Methanogenium marinum]
MHQNVIQPVGYCERGFLTLVTAPRPVLEKTLAGLLLHKSGDALVITCGRARDGTFVTAADGYPDTSVIRVGSQSQVVNGVRICNASLIVVVHDPEIYENDEEGAARVAAMLREYACLSANRIVILARPKDAYLDVMWQYAGRYLFIE